MDDHDDNEINSTTATASRSNKRRDGTTTGGGEEEEGVQSRGIGDRRKKKCVGRTELFNGRLGESGKERKGKGNQEPPSPPPSKALLEARVKARKRWRNPSPIPPIFIHSYSSVRQVKVGYRGNDGCFCFFCTIFPQTSILPFPSSSPSTSFFFASDSASSYFANDSRV
jgi:hypothetical protein